jgi:hypothetical protein
MAGRTIDGIRYVGLSNDNNYKNKSVEDNIYFTLRDIFWNGRECSEIMTANRFMSLLTDNISYDERDELFQYTNVVYDSKSNYTQNLYNWLLQFTKIDISNPDGRKDYLFDFMDVLPEEEFNINKYIKYDIWWYRLIGLINTLHDIIKYQT